MILLTDKVFFGIKLLKLSLPFMRKIKIVSVAIATRKMHYNKSQCLFMFNVDICLRHPTSRE